RHGWRRPLDNSISRVGGYTDTGFGLLPAESDSGIQLTVFMSEQINSAIEFHDVTMAYEERVILDEVSFVVNPGETKIVMGGSGTGKSTILKLVLGLIKPQAGRILIDGDDVTQMTEAELTAARRKIGMVFQEGA